MGVLSPSPNILNFTNMEKKTHYKKLSNPNYIGSHDLFDEYGKAKDYTLTIKTVVKEMVKGMEGKEEELVVCYFDGAKKPMILNKTNLKIISKKLDSPFIEDWKGKQVTLYVAKVKAFGEVVDALRIRAK